MTRLLLGTIACSVAGCATTSPTASHREVDTIVRERVGVSPRLEAAPVNAPTVEQATRTLVDGELDAQRAVEVALLNKPDPWSSSRCCGPAESNCCIEREPAPVTGLADASGSMPPDARSLLHVALAAGGPAPAVYATPRAYSGSGPPGHHGSRQLVLAQLSILRV